MVRVFAPFTPFLTENMYQKLKTLVKGKSKKKIRKLTEIEPYLVRIFPGLQKPIKKMKKYVSTASGRARVCRCV